MKLTDEQIEKDAKRYAYLRKHSIEENYEGTGWRVFKFRSIDSLTGRTIDEAIDDEIKRENIRQRYISKLERYENETHK